MLQCGGRSATLPRRLVQRPVQGSQSGHCCQFNTHFVNQRMSSLNEKTRVLQRILVNNARVVSIPRVPSCADRLDFSRYRISEYSLELSNDKQTRVGPCFVYPSLSRSSFPSVVHLWNDSFTHIDRLLTDS